MAHNLTQSDDAHIPPELIGVIQRMTPEQFEQLCRKYRKLRLELTSTGELIIMPPSGSESGRRNSSLIYQLVAWSREDGRGVCFDSSALFALPNGARRSPDAAWVRREKWDSLSEPQREGFAPICPDFVVELRSPTDNLSQLYLKMFEYLSNGISLGWLIDPFKKQVYVYRPDQEVVTLDNPDTVSGDPLLLGFKLNLNEIW